MTKATDLKFGMYAPGTVPSRPRRFWGVMLIAWKW